MKLMIAAAPVSVIHHRGRTYRPREDGKFEVPAAHVEELRAHGLLPEHEAADRAEAEAAARRLKELETENGRLKQADRERALAEENEKLRQQLEGGKPAKTAATEKAKA